MDSLVTSHRVSDIRVSSAVNSDWVIEAVTAVERCIVPDTSTETLGTMVVVLLYTLGTWKTVAFSVNSVAPFSL